MTAHIDGRPVSRNTYQRHGCRCDGCLAHNRATQTAYITRNRAAIRDRDRLRNMADTYREPIEQAIARGWTTTRIMAHHSVPYELVKRVRDGLEAVNAA